MSYNIKQGKRLRLKIDGAVVACATNCQYQYQANYQDILHKDLEAGDDNKILSSWNFSASSDAMVSSMSASSFVARLKEGTKVTATFIGEDGGDISESCYIDSVSCNAPVEGVSTYSVSVSATGLPVEQATDQTQ